MAEVDVSRCCVCAGVGWSGNRVYAAQCCGVVVHRRCVGKLMPRHHLRSCAMYEPDLFEGDEGDIEI
jgi:hypothetical protein